MPSCSDSDLAWSVGNAEGLDHVLTSFLLCRAARGTAEFSCFRFCRCRDREAPQGGAFSAKAAAGGPTGAFFSRERKEAKDRLGNYVS